MAAARFGMRTLLVEKSRQIGGTAVRGGVHVWEPGVGGTGIPFEIYYRLKRIPDAVGIYSFGRHCCWPNAKSFPGGESLIDPDRCYLDTLRRHGARSLVADEAEAFRRRYWHGVVFEPDAYVTAVREMLEETGNCTMRLNAAAEATESTDGVVRAVTLTDGTRIEADAWIDSTGDAVLCLACGCRAAPRGREPLNAVSLIYRITPGDALTVEPLPTDIPETCWWADAFPPMACTQYPNGDRNCNMLPTMPAEEYLSLGPKHAYRECIHRVRAHWHWVQSTYEEFRTYRLSWIAPALGVRETNHIECEYMLGEEDLVQGLSGQKHQDIIAIADHAMDRHGEGGGCVELSQPYGVPYRCLIPEGMQNLLVACRAAGFTSAASSSCRLSRTMMQIGQAAGTAVAIARELGCDLPDIPAGRQREALRAQHVQLEWPLTDELIEYLEDDHEDCQARRIVIL